MFVCVEGVEGGGLEPLEHLVSFYQNFDFYMMNVHNAEMLKKSVCKWNKEYNIGNVTKALYSVFQNQDQQVIWPGSACPLLILHQPRNFLVRLPDI